MPMKSKLPLRRLFSLGENLGNWFPRIERISAGYSPKTRGFSNLLAIKKARKVTKMNEVFSVISCH